MATILLLPAPGAERPDDRFDAVIFGTVKELAERYAAVVPADGLPAPPLLGAETSVALLCRTLDGFERWATQAPAGFDIVFQPNAVARLDWRARRRRTLVAARLLPAGHVLTDADLAEEIGGRGAEADRRAAFIGLALAYPLAEGQPLDLGMVLV